ncbi:exodeoxyribonuclease V subunit gamma [Cellulomonas sp. URHD0024]|uniref:exodeoxyribonuclease V subunit gamma n=1 Tax=Cellulomonas sp. URHD0024 TaxID=1302620 RepID=UPI001E46D89A|nr:exodeoxyribonuclease V subunit gamma [Cellulomonas sp. URHD0024]
MTGLRVHVAERTDVLVDALAGILATAPADPFAPDVVAVPTRGVERWVAQRLSHRLGTDAGDGICANVLFPSPSRLVSDALSRGADEDPWSPERLPWHVLATLDAHLDESWLAVVRRYLGTESDEVRRSRRFRLAHRLARLFGSYDTQRPAMLRAWAQGRHEDGLGEALPDDLAWQAALWRRVHDAIEVPAPAERLDEVVERLRADPSTVDLPLRLSVFGPTALPDGQLRVLDALAMHREVHLWLPQPSLALWSRLRTAGPRRSSLPGVARHPLLASMAGDAVELGTRVLALQPEVTVLPSAARPDSALGALQRRIAEDRTDSPPRVLDPTDRSVQVHACHGRSRQVEVLREVVVGLLADDPTLEPRDVIVMCPDVEAFAPLVEAAFGPAAGTDDDAPEHPGRTLRVRIADRAPARANPVLAVVATLLELADSRVGASAVVDLAGQAPVRRRFGFDDESLDRIRTWAIESGVRWGEDLARRERYQLGSLAQGTWSTALDRLLLGVAMAEEDQRFVGTVLPVDDVGSTDVDLVGRLAELVDRLAGTLAVLSGAHPAPEWFDALDRAVVLLTDVAPADRWQQAEAARVLAAARDAAGGSTLRLPDVVALLEPQLVGRPTRSGFRTGALTVCSLAPMRAVPHRVVALLGMDDGAFPRGSGKDGDDILARDPLVGERDARQEDRQLFLDAVTSAQEHLVVLYSGADERTGAARPPAVPVGELLDALDAATEGDAGERVVRHPLQTVDERNFVTGALGRPDAFSFDVLDLAAAVAGRGTRPAAPPFVATPLAPPPGDTIDLDDLASALEHPVRAFVRGRLGASLPGDEAQLDDRLPLELGGLEKWPIGDRLLQAALKGVPLSDAAAAERRRGHMPPATLGGAALAALQAQVEPLLAASERYLVDPAVSVDVTVPLPDGRAVTGTVNGLRGDVLVRTVFSRLGPKHRLRAWVQLLALTAAFPDRTFTAATVGRGVGLRSRVAMLTAPPAHDARTMLAGLVALRDQALCAPLPLPLGASYAYAHHRVGGGDESDALDAARTELGTAADAEAGRGGFESVDPYLLLAFGDPFTFDRLPALEFGALSVALWSAVVAHEEVAFA